MKEKPIVEFKGICISNEITLPDGSLVIDGMIDGKGGFEVVNYNDGEPMILQDGKKYLVKIFELIEDVK